MTDRHDESKTPLRFVSLIPDAMECVDSDIYSSGFTGCEHRDHRVRGRGDARKKHERDHLNHAFFRLLAGALPSVTMRIF